MESRIKRVMGNVFNIDVDSVNNDSSSDNIRNWDSLKHMNLIVALEEEFEVEFDDEEIDVSMNYTSLLKMLKSK